MQESTDSACSHLTDDGDCCLNYLNRSDEMKDNDGPRVRGDSAVNIIPFQRSSSCTQESQDDMENDGAENPPILQNMSSSSSSVSSLNGASTTASTRVSMKSLSRNTLRKLKRIGQEED